LIFAFGRAFHHVTLVQGIEMIFRLGIALLELHQDELMLLSMEEMLKVGPLTRHRRCRMHMCNVVEREELKLLIDTYE
jgi:hypothetical protein